MHGRFLQVGLHSDAQEQQYTPLLLAFGLKMCKVLIGKTVGIENVSEEETIAMNVSHANMSEMRFYDKLDTFSGDSFVKCMHYMACIKQLYNPLGREHGF